MLNKGNSELTEDQKMGTRYDPYEFNGLDLEP